MRFSFIELRQLYCYRIIASYRSTHTSSTNWTNIYAKSPDKGHASSDKASDKAAYEATDNTHGRTNCSAYAEPEKAYAYSENAFA
ncbi:hypothetical protein MTO96_024399 [Rhipicephalus appendiculatus]